MSDVILSLDGQSALSSSWYPLGRIVGGTVHPGIMYTAAVMYNILHFIGLKVNIRDVCVSTAPTFSAFIAGSAYELLTSRRHWNSICWKSSLRTEMTGAYSETAAYEFTTSTCIPGLLYYKEAKTQLLDLPRTIEGAKDEKGRGRQVIAVSRSGDPISTVRNASKPASHKRLIEHELKGLGIRLNRKPPPIIFRQKDRSGISPSSAIQTELTAETVKSVCAEYKNADFVLRGDCDVDDII